MPVGSCKPEVLQLKAHFGMFFLLIPASFGPKQKQIKGSHPDLLSFYYTQDEKVALTYRKYNT